MAIVLENTQERKGEQRHYSYFSNWASLRILLPSGIAYWILSSTYIQRDNNIDFDNDNDDDTITGIPHININININTNTSTELSSIQNGDKNRKKKKKKKKAALNKYEEEEEEKEEASLSSSLLWTDEDPNRTHWWEPYVNTTSRTWDNIINTTQDKNNYHDWCNPINISNDDPNIEYPFIPSQKKNVTLNGIIYIKSYKTASSTAEGINVQIAHNGKYINLR
jgi:hypothetical protein